MLEAFKEKATDREGQVLRWEVTNKKGERGWVPERYLRRQGKSAIATTGYDTTTLDPSEGDVLTVIEEDTESGWVWCHDNTGNLGWFAIDHLAQSDR